MATIEFGTITSTSIQWRITELTNPFNQTYYQEAGGASQNFTNGQSTEPSYSFNWVTAPSTGTTTYTPWMTRSGLSPNTSYTFYGWAQAANGLYYQSGYATRMTLSATCDQPGPVYADRLTPSATSSSLYCYWGASDTDGVTYRLEYTNTTDGGTPLTITTSNTYYTLSYLPGGTSFSLRVRAEKSGYTSSAYTSANSSTTLPVIPPTVTTQTGSITSNSIRVYVGSVASGYCTDIRVRLYNSTGTVLITTLSAVQGGSVNFTGLNPSTTYKIDSESRYYINGVNLYSSDNASSATSTTGRSTRQTYTTSALPIPEPPSISFSSRTTTSLTFIRGTSSDATSYNSYLEGSLYATNVGTTFTVSGLAPGYSYEVGVSAVNSSGTSDINTLTRATLCSAPSLTFVSATYNSLTFTRGVSNGATYYQVYLDGEYYGTAPSTTINITGLAPTTSYTVGVGAVNADGALSALTSLTRATLSARPTNWTAFDWIVSGAEYYDFDSSNKIAYPITALSWNQFVDKINEFRVYKGLAEYSFTAVSSGTDFSKTYINQAITAINAMGFSQSSVISGQNVSASIFQTMKNNLNSIT